jgi:uncharacterized protein YjeT (DUF2065 family)
MSVLAIAIALVLVIEGLAYALFPGPLKRTLAWAVGAPEDTLRAGGLVAAAIGVVAIWLIHG